MQSAPKEEIVSVAFHPYKPTLAVACVTKVAETTAAITYIRIYDISGTIPTLYNQSSLSSAISSSSKEKKMSKEGTLLKVGELTVSGSVSAIQFSPDGRLLGAASHVNSEQLLSASAHASGLPDKADRITLYLASQGFRVVKQDIWDFEVRRVREGLREVKTHGRVTGAAISLVFHFHRALITTLAFCPDPRSQKDLRKARDAGTGKRKSIHSQVRKQSMFQRRKSLKLNQKGELEGEEDEDDIQRLLRRETRLVASGSTDGVIRLWDFYEDRTWEVPARDNAVRQLTFSPDGRILLGLLSTGTVLAFSIDHPEIDMEAETAMLSPMASIPPLHTQLSRAVSFSQELHFERAMTTDLELGGEIGDKDERTAPPPVVVTSKRPKIILFLFLSLYPETTCVCFMPVTSSSSSFLLDADDGEEKDAKETASISDEKKKKREPSSTDGRKAFQAPMLMAAVGDRTPRTGSAFSPLTDGTDNLAKEGERHFFRTFSSSPRLVPDERKGSDLWESKYGPPPGLAREQSAHPSIASTAFTERAAGQKKRRRSRFGGTLLEDCLFIEHDSKTPFGANASLPLSQRETSESSGSDDEFEEAHKHKRQTPKRRSIRRAQHIRNKSGQLGKKSKYPKATYQIALGGRNMLNLIQFQFNYLKVKEDWNKRHEYDDRPDLREADIGSWVLHTSIETRSTIESVASHPGSPILVLGETRQEASATSYRVALWSAIQQNSYQSIGTHENVITRVATPLPYLLNGLATKGLQSSDSIVASSSLDGTFKLWLWNEDRIAPVRNLPSSSVELPPSISSPPASTSPVKNREQGYADQMGKDSSPRKSSSDRSEQAETDSLQSFEKLARTLDHRGRDCGCIIA